MDFFLKLLKSIENKKIWVGFGEPILNDISKKIIAENKDISKKKLRKMIREAIHYEVDIQINQIRNEIREFKPMGKLTEYQEALHTSSAKGITLGTPFGTYVFAKNRKPSRMKVEKWFDLFDLSEELLIEAINMDFEIYKKPNTITGNFRIIQHGRWLLKNDLLDNYEIEYLKTLEEFWVKHPELNKQDGYGIWTEDGQILTSKELKSIKDSASNK